MLPSITLFGRCQKAYRLPPLAGCRIVISAEGFGDRTHHRHMALAQQLGRLAYEAESCVKRILVAVESRASVKSISYHLVGFI